MIFKRLSGHTHKAFAVTLEYFGALLGNFDKDSDLTLVLLHKVEVPRGDFHQGLDCILPWAHQDLEVFVHLFDIRVQDCEKYLLLGPVIIMQHSVGYSRLLGDGVCRSRLVALFLEELYGRLQYSAFGSLVHNFILTYLFNNAVNTLQIYLNLRYIDTSNMIFLSD